MPDTSPNDPEKKPRPMFLTTLLTSGAILLCRFSGMIREAVFGRLFGQGLTADTFNIAFRVPNLLRDLLAEGALSQSFTSVLAKKKQAFGADAAWVLSRRLFSQVVLLMIIIITLGILFAEPIMALMFQGSQEALPLATLLNQIMWPFIGFVSFGALVMGMLNTVGVFALPMLASCAFNVVTIILGLALGWFIDPSFGPKALIGFAIAVTLGGAAQWLVQCPALRKAGFRFRFDFQWKNDEDLAKIWKITIPVALAAGVTQINVLINMIFAREISDGAATALQQAFRIWQLPVGLFGVATGMIVLPEIARMVKNNDKGEILSKLSQSFRQIAFFAVPSFIILFMFPAEAVSILYQGGKFTAQNSINAGMALQTYSLGLLGYAGMKIAQPAFVALEKKWVPLIITLGSLCINVSMNYTFVRIWHKDFSWLAITTSVVTTLNFLAYYVILSRFLGSFGNSTLFKGILRITLAAIPMALACWGGKFLFMEHFLEWGFIARTSVLATFCGLAGVIYVAGCYLLKSPEMLTLADYLKKRLLKKQSRQS